MRMILIPWILLLSSCSSSPSSPQFPKETGGDSANIAAPAPPVWSAPRLLRLQREAESRLRAEVRPKNCETWLKELTRLPHVAGTRRNQELSRWLANTLRQFGCQVEVHTYEVLLPFPLQVRVEMTAPTAYSATLREESLELDLDTAHRTILPFNAFTPDCDITAPVIYANYARREDFEQLRDLGIDCGGKIVLARYGRIYRGAKAKIAEEFGAAGLILYSDPADDGFVKGDVYPHGRFRPSSAVERGSILDISTCPGDPGTPGRPSLPGAEQLTFDQMSSLPSLPTTCISQDDARPILENLGGSGVPEGWQGGVPTTYHLGEDGTVRLRLQLEMDYRLRRIQNITATLTGLRAPDEVILVGNHRDAWTHGAMDPGSGTAVVLEAARVLAQAASRGQTLDRTVRFAFWDAEEFGIIGSTEYGEQFAEDLQKNCVAYINMDTAVSGSKLWMSGTPHLKSFAAEVLSSIPGEEQGRSLKDMMRDKQGAFRFGTLGSGSDYTVFLAHLGIDCLDLASGGATGVYHSVYDTYVFMKRFVDPGFRHHGRMAGTLLTLLSRLGRSQVLPLRFQDMADYVRASAEKLEQEDASLDLGEFVALSERIRKAGASIQQQVQGLVQKDMPLGLQLDLNRRLMGLSRRLLLKDGLARRPWYRHIFFAPHPDKGYGSDVLPGIRDALRTGDHALAQKEARRALAALTDYVRGLEELELFLSGK